MDMAEVSTDNKDIKKIDYLNRAAPNRQYNGYDEIEESEEEISED
jgi:hypothetical protein